MSDKVILYDSDDAAVYRTDIKGWVSHDGLYFGENEDGARRHSLTHVECENCHELKVRDYSRFYDACARISLINKWNDMLKRVWDGDTPVFVFVSPEQTDDDSFTIPEWFDSGDDLCDYVYDHGIDPSALMLVHSTPMSVPAITSDIFEGYTPDDWDDRMLPDSVTEAMDALNAAIGEMGSLGFEMSKYAVVFSDRLMAEFEKIKKQTPEN